MSSRWLNSASYFFFFILIFFFPAAHGLMHRESQRHNHHQSLWFSFNKAQSVLFFFFFLLVSLWKYLYYKSSRLLERHPKVFYPSTYIPGAHRYLLVRAKKQVLVMPTVIVPISGKVLLPVDKKKKLFIRGLVRRAGKPSAIDRSSIR